MVRTGGTYGAVSVGWRITRGGEDPSPVTADLSPTSGVLQFADGERAVAVSLQVVQDVEAEEAEKFIFEMINGSAQGGAELTDPFQVQSNPPPMLTLLTHMLSFLVYMQVNSLLQMRYRCSPEKVLAHSTYC